MLLVKIKKLDENAVVPEYAKIGDAGLDLIATSFEIKELYTEYGTGLAIEIPEGYVGLLFPRSSVSNTDLMLANSVGVVDSGYRGELKVRFKSTNFKPYLDKLYDVGDKVAQLIIIPYPQIELIEVDELSSTERGEGGFGHTGK